MSAMRPKNPCEGDGLSSRAPEPLLKRKGRAALHMPGTLRLPCDRIENPRRWFVPGLVTGGGLPSPVTAGNEVCYLVDAPVYFADLVGEIAGAGASDFVYIIGWYVGLEFPLIPDALPPLQAAETTLGSVLQGAAERGAEIRLLLFGNPTSMVNATAADTINNMVSPAGDRLNTCAILDTRLLLAGAHHQKLIVVRRKGELTGYCGGIDLNPDRLFPQSRPGRKTLNESLDRGDPYHDVQCRIRGEGAGYLLRTFTERWYDQVSHQVGSAEERKESNWQVADAQRELDRIRQFYDQGLKSREELEQAERALDHAQNEVETFLPLCVERHPAPPPPPPAETHAFANRQLVQIGRTYGDPLDHSFWSPFKSARKADAAAPVSDLSSDPVKDFRTYDFAPHGEQTIKQLLLRAISRAQRFIYVEDQYLMDVEIARAVAAVLPRLAHFTAMIPLDDDLETSYRFDTAGGLGPLGIVELPIDFFQNHAVPLRQKFFAALGRGHDDRVRIFTHNDPGGEHTYVHSKMWIIDDEFVLIGSANCNQRSMTHDAEICAAIADEPRKDSCGLSLAHRLRIALWAEHLGMDHPQGHAELLDGVASAIHWLDEKRPGTRVTKHVPGTNQSQNWEAGLELASEIVPLIPGLWWTRVPAGIMKGSIKFKKYVFEPALIPIVFDPFGGCPHRQIHTEGTSEILDD